MQRVFANKIKEFISRNNLLTDGATMIVGLSGGADSTALLKVLLMLGYRCIAVHCNFHLRGQESDRDQQFVTDLCRELGVQLIVRSYDTASYAKQNGISIEMAARELRYADFKRIMAQYDASAICIAHHRDDSVETIILNLIRGTGLRGLTGIKPRNGHIVRPLLCVSRQEIEDWLKLTGQEYVTDSTNLATDYTRNKIRLELLPLMRRINPSADSSIESTALHLQQAYAFYSKAIDNARREVVRESGQDLVIDIDKLKETESVQALLFEILSPLGFNDALIKEIASSVDSQPGTEFSSATHNIIKDRDAFIVTPVDKNDFEPVIINPDKQTFIELTSGKKLIISTAPAGTKISAEQSTATFDASLLDDNITVRLWRDGDWFIPFGMKGRKLVSDYLTDRKMSLADKRRQLVMTCNDNIIWVVGLRSDNRFRVTEKTTRQLIIKLID